MINKPMEDDLLPAPTPFGSAPPASSALLEAVGSMKPVRTRARLGGFFLVLLVGILGPALTLVRYPLRRDLAALPLSWVVVGAFLWAAAFGLSLATALIPRRHDVLPSVGRASRVSMLAVGVLFLFAALWTAHAPGVSVRPEDLGQTLLESCLGCGSYVLQVAAVVLLAGFLVVRRVLPVGGRRLGIALGAAGGAVAGLVLHFHCPVATAAHVLLSHVGATMLAMGAGALILSALLDT